MCDSWLCLTQLQSGMQQQIQEHFHTTDFIATLGVGLFNFVSICVVDAVPRLTISCQGSIFGPLIGGPLSELYGRRPVYIGASVGFVCESLRG